MVRSASDSAAPPSPGPTMTAVKREYPSARFPSSRPARARIRGPGFRGGKDVRFLSSRVLPEEECSNPSFMSLRNPPATTSPSSTSRCGTGSPCSGSSWRWSSSTCCWCTARPHVITVKEAAIESAVWISIGLAFTGVIYMLAATAMGQGGRRVPLRLPDREVAVDRQRLRVGGDLQLLRGARGVPVPGPVLGHLRRARAARPSSSSPASR